MHLRRLALSLALAVVPAGSAVLGGIAESCLEFGSAIPGTFDRTYTVPLNSSAAYFHGKRFAVTRLPFMWERLQPTLTSVMGDVVFDSFYLGLITEFTAFVTGQGQQIILDPHNYARYRGNVIGASGSNVTSAQFAAFWGALAARFMDNPLVIFGIMNEPNTMATELWVEDANAAIAAIRGIGATNLLTVPGNAWTGACSWFQDWYGTPNAQAMTAIVDPLHHYVVELHLYFDADHGGGSPNCTSPTIGVECLTQVTAWLRSHGVQGFIGEFAGGDNAVCEQAVTNTLSHLAANADAYWGWSWWAAGPWWGAANDFSLEPGAPPNVDRPQMAWLEPFVA